MTRPTALLLALAMSAVALLPPASAEGIISGDVLAQSLNVEGAATQGGRLGFLHVGQPEKGPLLSLQASGALIEGRQYTEQGYEAVANGRSVSDLRLLSSVVPNDGAPFSVGHATLSLAGHTEFVLNVFTDDAADLHAEWPAGNETLLPHPQLGPSGITEPGQSPVPVGTPLDASASGGGGNYWSIRTSEDAQVLTATSGETAIRLTGSFTLEVIGIDFQLQAAGVDQTLHSGTTRTPLQPGAPDTVHAIREDFLRISIRDGDLRMVVGGAPLLQWSSPAVETRASALTLEGATGSLVMPNGDREHLNGATYHLDGHPYDLTTDPSQQGLQLGITGLDSHGDPIPPPTTVHSEAPVALWVAALAALALAGAVALAVLLRRRQPTMADLESHLETGQFRRAARDAARILARRPGFEDALISRAIALSKLGQDRRVVREVEAHMAQHDPSDGVLHYVLGLSLKGLGRTERAEAALREAVRRTPSLEPQVRPHLAHIPGQQASSTDPPVAPLVDGPAYA